MRENSKKYSNFDIVVVLVGANDLGKLKINQTIEELLELLYILQEANPKAAIYACDVCSKIALQII